MSTLLAFDTSTEQLAVALATPAGDFGHAEDGGARASARLLPAVQALLDRAGVTLSSVDAIAFGRGPGAFTGLRTSCAVAQGLGLGLDRPLLPLDSLLVVAEDARVQHAAQAPRFEVAVAMDARMGEAYAARYAWADGGWSTRVPPALCSLDVLAADWAAHAPSHVAGSALLAFADRLAAPGATRSAHEHDRAAALLRLARAAWSRGEAVRADDALPLYLRDKVAQTTAERAAAKAAA